MDFSNVKSITIPEGTVKQIQDSNGNILWKGSWTYTINIGDYVSTVRYKIGSGNWTTISASTTIEIDSGLTLYVQALSYNTDTAQYHYTLYNGDISRTEADDGGSVNVYQTRQLQQYAVTIEGTRCTANKASGTYSYGTVITWTANTNCAFNSTGTTTTQTATITGSGTYSKTASYVKCTTSGTNCSADKTGWMAYGTTITWWSDSDHYFMMVAGEPLDYVTDTAIPGSLSKTAPYLRQYKVVINNKSSYTIYVQAEDASDFTIASGSSSTLTYDYGYSSYVKFKKDGDSTWSSTVTYSSSSDTRSNHSLNAYISTSTSNQFNWDGYGQDYTEQSSEDIYRSGARRSYRGFGSWSGHNPFYRSSSSTHIRMYWNGNPYIAPIPSGMPTSWNDSSDSWYNTSATVSPTGYYIGGLLIDKGEEDREMYGFVGFETSGNHPTSYQFGTYDPVTTYSPYWG